MAAAAATALTATQNFASLLINEDDQLFGNFCVYCGNDSLPEQSYCSSICELQDLQPTNEQQYLVPALVTSGGRSTGSSSSLCSTPPTSPHASPANALGNIDELSAEISNFHLPPSMLLGSKALPVRSLNFDYGYVQKKEEQVASSPASSVPTFLGHLHSRQMQKTRSQPGVTDSQEGSPTTPTENILRFQRNPAQHPAAPRRESRGLLSPQLKPTNPSSFDQSLLKSKKSKTTTAISAPCGKPGCPSLHLNSRPTMPSVRRPSAPISRSRLFVHSDEEDADSEASQIQIRGRARSKKRSLISENSLVDGTKGKRSESAHALGAGVCARFQADLTRRKTGFVVVDKMTPLDLGDSAVRSSSSDDEDESEDLRNRGRGRSAADDMGTERGRSKKREGPATRRSKSRHREFSR